jgi:molybdenum cofactor cytidylyltransferase
MSIGIVILAAGGSGRMGKAKQTLQVETGKSMLRRTAEIALETSLRPVVVVVGANKKEVVPELDSLGVTIIDNSKWADGVSSSMTIGLAGLYMMHKGLTGAIVLTCDQPFVTTELIEYLVHRFEKSGKKAVMSKYGKKSGFPLLIGSSFFAEVTHLTGEEEVTKVLEKHVKEIDYVDFDKGSVDINTPEEYLHYIQSLSPES